MTFLHHLSLLPLHIRVGCNLLTEFCPKKEVLITLFLDFFFNHHFLFQFLGLLSLRGLGLGFYNTKY